ncbi:hypothetical protein Tco_0541908, partial [Tanacetum coccineum]
AGIADPTCGTSLVGQLRAAYESAIKGLVGTTTGVHQLSHITDHLGGKPALVNDRSSKALQCSIAAPAPPPQAWRPSVV